MYMYYKYMYMCTYICMNKMPCKRELDYLEWIGFWSEYFFVFFVLNGFFSLLVWFPSTCRDNEIFISDAVEIKTVFCSVLHCVAVCCSVL